MEPATWQLVIALTVVAAAVAVLARRAYRMFRGADSAACGSGGCGNCANDASANGTQARPLVSLNLSAPAEDVSASSFKTDA